jgi:predicted outer membrane protein
MISRASLFIGPIVLCASALGAQPQAQEPDPTPPPRGTTSFTPLPDLERQPLTPANFVTRAAIANMSEIELGQMALQKSDDPAIKEFAEQLIQHHRAAMNELRTVAAQQHLALPGTVDEDHRKVKQQLSTLNDAAFDRRYLEAMTTGHDKAVALFEAATQTPELPVNLKSYASESLATLKEHRKTARALSAAE